MLRKLFVILFLGTGAFAQSKLQVTFNPGFYAYDVPQNGAMTNDPGFDQILNNHGATVAPLADSDFGTATNMGLVNCPDQNLINLRNTLTAYSTVVKKACDESQMFVSSDKLKISLVDPNDGIYVGTVNGIVQSNNAQLNAVFQTYEVDYYQYDSNYQKYNVRARGCDANGLKLALQGLPSVIAQVERVNYVILLGNESFAKPIFAVYPNPFKDAIVISSDSEIEKMQLYDVAGKEVFLVNSLEEFNKRAATLESGMYFLKAFFNDGAQAFNRIIKN